MLLAVRIPLISDHDQFVARLFRVQVNLEAVVPHRRVKEARCKRVVVGRGELFKPDLLAIPAASGLIAARLGL
jgi:hypothetical protein